MVSVVSGDTVTIEGKDVVIPYSYEPSLDLQQILYLIDNQIYIKILDKPRITYDPYQDYQHELQCN